MKRRIISEQLHELSEDKLQVRLSQTWEEAFCIYNEYKLSGLSETKRTQYTAEEREFIKQKYNEFMKVTKFIVKKPRSWKWDVLTFVAIECNKHFHDNKDIRNSASVSTILQSFAKPKNQPVEHVKKCEYCGKEFITKRNDKKCCCASHSSMLYADKNIEKTRKAKRDWARKNSEI